ncbi:MAG: hypothetical protein R3C99_09580 [Pirellulaceae bacterium]
MRAAIHRRERLSQTARLALATLIGISAATLSTAQAQQSQPRNDVTTRPDGQAMNRQMLRIPGDAAMIGIQAMAPQEVRVGERFHYEVAVKNLTDNVVLHNIKLKQDSGQGFQIEKANLESSAKPQGDEQQRDSQANDARNSSNRQRRQDQAASSDQDQSDRNAKNARGARQFAEARSEGYESDDSRKKSGKGGQSNSGQAKNEWTIDKLMPGETRVLHVQAAADQEGQTRACLAVTSYQPSLCLMMKVVKPELELVKQAPDTATLCRTIEVEYFVKNEGSGPTDSFVIRDELADGLQTTNGDKNLEFKVDPLEPNETKKFVATLTAIKSGSFSSRAVAERENGEQVRSNQTTTQVRQADLRVAINGPEVEYIRRPVTYQIRVTNSGDAPAPNTQLVMHYPDDVRLARVGDPRRQMDDSQGNQQQSRSNRSNEARRNAANNDSDERVSRQAPEPAAARDSQRSQQSNDDADNESTSNQRSNENANNASDQGSQANNQEQSFAETHASRDWQLGTLEPGETVTLNVTVRGSEAQMLKQKVVATFDCDADHGKAKTQAVAMAETELIALPALLLTVVDNHDPVAQDDEVVYSIVVVNQGDAPDHQVKVTAELPQALEFVDAEGPTKAQQSGRSLDFGPIEQLDAGERATWQVRAKAKPNKGDILFQASLKSDGLSRTARAEEPTQLFTR